MVIDLGQELRRRGSVVRTVFPTRGATTTFTRWAQALDPQIELSDALLDAAAPHRPRDLMALARFVRQCRPDIVHLHYGSGFVSLQDVVAARIAGVTRIFATVHQAVAWSSLGSRKRRSTAVAGRWLLRQSAAVCHAGFDLLLEAGVPESRAAMLYCGVQPPNRPPARSLARRQLRLPAGGFVLLVAATLRERKGIPDVIRALAEVRRHQNVDRCPYLLVAGDGPERAKLEAQANAEIPGHHAFLGHLDDQGMATAFSAADVLVLPSYAEGVPLVLHEAAIRGVCSIATDVGGVREVLTNGVTGLIVEPRRPDQIAAAVMRLLHDPGERERMGAAARSRAHAEFSATAMADAYEDLYRG